MLNLFEPYVPNEALTEVNETLQGRWIGQSNKVNQFEYKFSKMFGVRYPVSLNSGTASLELAYDLLDLGPGDEVITTPFTCTATNIPLLRRGVKLVFADILATTMNIDPKDVKRKMTHKTKAVVQVHVGGIGADVGKLRVPVISDACQALGIFKGDFTCNSFQAIKHITTGDGGMLTCPDDKTYKAAKLKRWFGIDREKKEENNWQCYKDRKMVFDIEVLGYKWHMNDIAAGMGLAGLLHYCEVIRYRRQLFNLYKRELSSVPGIKLIDGELNTYWLCTALVERRDDFAKMLYEKEVDTNIVHMRNDIYKIFGGKRQDLPVMNMLEENYICLPLHMNVTEEDVLRVCENIRRGW